MARVLTPSDFRRGFAFTSFPVFRFTDIRKPKLRKSLEIVFDELQQDTCRGRIAALHELRRILSSYGQLKNDFKSLPTADESRRWRAAIRLHADELVKLSMDPVHYYSILSFVNGASALSNPSPAMAQNVDNILSTLQLIRDRAAEDPEKWQLRQKKDLPFVILLIHIERLYFLCTVREAKISATLDGKNSGPFIRLMKAVCELAGEPSRTNESIAIAFRRNVKGVGKAR
jgi:hypothetical protein